ncbi:hypothetical protein HYFRA_00007955 [Hymenoscyphus fraxineus]|uniref:Uncharacterized protein n=1 Tax=Hymenoscyphus fraxineus TaxID=746836 RepID=A0A9N9KR53_9HELO|nr:hypothetical protein HYFRA_00007955 [Hymenoscyphus fraxineus]
MIWPWIRSSNQNKVTMNTIIRQNIKQRNVIYLTQRSSALPNDNTDLHRNESACFFANEGTYSENHNTSHTPESIREIAHPRYNYGRGYSDHVGIPTRTYGLDTGKNVEPILPEAQWGARPEPNSPPENGPNRPSVSHLQPQSHVMPASEGFSAAPHASPSSGSSNAGQQEDDGEEVANEPSSTSDFPPVLTAESAGLSSNQHLDSILALIQNMLGGHVNLGIATYPNIFIIPI